MPGRPLDLDVSHDAYKPTRIYIERLIRVALEEAWQVGRHPEAGWIQESFTYRVRERPSQALDEITSLVIERIEQSIENVEVTEND